MPPVKHPAKYSDNLLEVLVRHVPARTSTILDPFAGTGKVAELRRWLPNRQVQFWGAEIEREWALLATASGCRTIQCSTIRLPYADASFDGAITSPTYANRMADHFQARDTSKRNTYKHVLGHDLHPENSGGMQWGPEYRNFHVAAWAEVYRVVKPGGFLVLNIKDHIRKGVRQDVSGFHLLTLIRQGFAPRHFDAVPCPGQRQGRNGNLRVDFEEVIFFKKE